MTADDRTPERRPDLVEPEGVNAGSGPAERDRRPDATDQVPASAATIHVPQPESEPAAGEELVGAAGQRDDRPGQQLEVGEG